MIRILAVCALLPACTGDPDPCDDGARIELQPAALDFGDVFARERDDPGDPTTAQQVPTRRVLLIQNTCGAALQIAETCIIEDAHNGVDGDPAFFLEPLERTRLPNGETGGLRVTYDHPDLNDDLDLDGARDPDRAILVIRSNAADAPTRVVPLCGRIIRGDEAPNPLPCPEPFTIPAGEDLPDLCTR